MFHVNGITISNAAQHLWFLCFFNLTELRVVQVQGIGKVLGSWSRENGLEGSPELGLAAFVLSNQPERESSQAAKEPQSVPHQCRKPEGGKEVRTHWPSSRPLAGPGWGHHTPASEWLLLALPGICHVDTLSDQYPLCKATHQFTPLEQFSNPGPVNSVTVPVASDTFSVQPPPWLCWLNLFCTTGIFPDR